MSIGINMQQGRVGAEISLKMLFYYFLLYVEVCINTDDYTGTQQIINIYGSGQTSERGVMMWQSEASLLK